MQKRITATVTGRVQMVMFRDFVQRRSSGLGLTGWVKNLDDGSVLVVAEGGEHELTQLIAQLNRGPLLSRVDHVEVSWSEATGEFSKFVITH